MSTFSRLSLPRGIRNNNPGNIRITTDSFQGLRNIQNDPEFFQFVHPRHGIGAIAIMLKRYRQDGLTTLQQIISAYALKNRKDIDIYVRFVSKEIAVMPEEKLDLDTYLFDLVKAIIKFENGKTFSSFYGNFTIREGIALG